MYYYLLLITTLLLNLIKVFKVFQASKPRDLIKLFIKLN